MKRQTILQGWHEGIGISMRVNIYLNNLGSNSTSTSQNKDGFTCRESSSFKAFVGSLNNQGKASSFNKTKIIGFQSQ